MSSQPIYEPLPADAHDEPVKRKRVSRKKRNGGGKGKTAAIIIILLLIVVGVILAITLPLVLSKHESSSAVQARGGSAAAVSHPLDPKTASVDQLIAAAEGASPLGNTLPAADSLQPSMPTNTELVDRAVTPARPDENVGDVWCYTKQRGPLGTLAQRYIPSNSIRYFESTFRKLGPQKDVDGVIRSQVESCGTGGIYWLRSDRLEKCSGIDRPCQQPIWMTVRDGNANDPLWTQEYVCQGVNVYANTKTTRHTFYLHYMGWVRETLVTQCDTNDAYWVPLQELRFCAEKEVDTCVKRNELRTTPVGPLVIHSGPPPPALAQAGPICTRFSTVASLSTGRTRNKFYFSRFASVPEVHVTACDGSLLDPHPSNPHIPASWVALHDVVPCHDDLASQCDKAHKIAAQSALPTVHPVDI